MKLGLISFLAAIPLVVAACGAGDDNGAYSPPPINNVGPDGGASSGPDATTGGADGAPSSGSEGGGVSTSEDASTGDGAIGQCLTTFSYVPPAGTTVTSLSVSGGWNAWASPGQTMTGPDVNGAYSTQVALPVGELQD